ncbi:unnamed protein product [Polarella glacialis]|uniref:Uncharacterized protein n=1 Tax=Polarella glacialis TaxID=89957 RepID=A0A813EQP3_POLGL|nr:unnamed protein product [Polarella glacialis]CAE8678788.1 unnamed protein product [Polarella glacialis]
MLGTRDSTQRACCYHGVLACDIQNYYMYGAVANGNTNNQTQENENTTHQPTHAPAQTKQRSSSNNSNNNHNNNDNNNNQLWIGTSHTLHSTPQASPDREIEWAIRQCWSQPKQRPHIS